MRLWEHWSFYSEQLAKNEEEHHKNLMLAQGNILHIFDVKTIDERLENSIGDKLGFGQQINLV